MENRSLIQTCVDVVVENGSEKLTCRDLVAKNGNERLTCVDHGGENMSEMLTCIDLCVENVCVNRGLEWWVEPCSVSDARLLFLLLVWLQQTVK